MPYLGIGVLSGKNYTALVCFCEIKKEDMQGMNKVYSSDGFRHGLDFFFFKRDSAFAGILQFIL